MPALSTLFWSEAAVTTGSWLERTVTLTWAVPVRLSSGSVAVIFSTTPREGPPIGAGAVQVADQLSAVLTVIALNVPMFGVAERARARVSGTRSGSTAVPVRVTTWFPLTTLGRAWIVTSGCKILIIVEK